MSKEQAAKGQESAAASTPRRLEDITPSQILANLKGGVLGQDDALRFVSVAIYKHTTGKVPGNILLIGNSGTGKTTIMNNIQRLYHEVPEYQPFRAMTIINANLLVDSDRLEFRPERLLDRRRAAGARGHRPSRRRRRSSRTTMERATICIDEIDKMSAVVAGKPNPIGVVLQQGLLTLMEGDVVPIRTHVVGDGEEKPRTLEIDTARDDVHLRRRVRGALRPGLHAGDRPRKRREPQVRRRSARPTARCASRRASPSPTTSRSRTSSPTAWCRSSSPASTTWSCSPTSGVDVLQARSCSKPSTRRSCARAASSRSWASRSRSTTSPPR